MVNISIPEELKKRIEEIGKKKGYSNVDEFIVYLLRKSLSTEETWEGIPLDEKEEIKKKLKGLGYL